MKLICDNQVALYIIFIPVFHENTKYVEIDCHFLKDKVLSKKIITGFIGTNNQLTNIFVTNLFVAYDIYASF